ncbi:helix-turn-helix domain-containing protein [Halorientalis salina]|uniref:helix-turn-helix domain-containing protein n=1 Tax=Halorientalis salina TaxID=2932266 RepID=UPI0010ACB520|nr:helix-turn-helix domain-containing protein [Halorientalis salina]
MTMRYFTFTLIPLEDSDFHPTIAALKEDPDITPEQMKYISLREDKTGVVLVGLRGDEAAAEAVFEAHPSALDWELIPGDSGFYAYVHFDDSDPAVGLLQLLDDYRLVLDLPLQFTSEGWLRVTVIGSDDNIQEALANVPDSIKAEATEMGTFQPDDSRAVAGLTERQREVLEAAVELGYYEVPRQATYEEIAEACDCTVGTVGEHLNRIEARIIASTVN